MKFLTILGFLFICAQAFANEIIDALQKLPLCVEELGLKLEKIQEILNLPELPEDNEEFNNFLTCHYTRIGFLKDEKLDLDAIRTMTPLWLKYRFGEYVDAEKISADVLEICEDAIENDSGIIGGIRLRNCASNYYKSLNLNAVN